MQAHEKRKAPTRGASNWWRWGRIERPVQNRTNNRIYAPPIPSYSLQAAIYAQVQSGHGRIVSKPRIAARCGVIEPPRRGRQVREPLVVTAPTHQAS